MPISRFYAKLIVSFALIAVAVADPVVTHAFLYPSQICTVNKLGAAGRYQSCIASAIKSPESFDDEEARCGTKLVDGFDKAEGDDGNSCESIGDGPSVRSFLSACQASVLDALRGGPLVLVPWQCTIARNACSVQSPLCQTAVTACATDCPAAVRQPLMTGQTTCYDSDDALIPCTDTGQDGELRKGAVRSFTDNADGTITDNVTGLMWEKHSDEGGIHDRDNKYSWADAFSSKIAALNSASYAGYNDWRLPNVNELATLRNLGKAYPSAYIPFDSSCVEGCTTSTCSCTNRGYYWTSSTEQIAPTYGYCGDFEDGQMWECTKGSLLYVRAVRSSM